MTSFHLWYSPDANRCEALPGSALCHPYLPLNDGVWRAALQPNVTLYSTIAGECSCTVAIPIAAQKTQKVGLAQVKRVLRLLQIAPRHEPVTDDEHQMARRPEQGHHSGFTRFSQGKDPLHLAHEPPEQRPAPERQPLSLNPSGATHPQTMRPAS